MPNYNQTLASKDNITITTYYKNPCDQYPLMNVYVQSIDGETVVARRGEIGSYKNHTKAELFKYINFRCFSSEAP